MAPGLANPRVGWIAVQEEVRGSEIACGPEEGVPCRHVARRLGLLLGSAPDMVRQLVEPRMPTLEVAWFDAVGNAQHFRDVRPSVARGAEHAKELEVKRGITTQL